MRFFFFTNWIEKDRKSWTKEDEEKKEREKNKCGNNKNGHIFCLLIPYGSRLTHRLSISQLWNIMLYKRYDSEREIKMKNGINKRKN